ncbi:3-oxoacyl-[acyl-carrier-protein] reductase OS=Ureibacillus acetophenoni OX=614649 GN=SAMN05877842_103274 PE=3 SV=1 [Ureibacillus acetophenoni]
MRLKDKVAIITGGANGIGKAAVEVFVNEGAKVVIADFAEEQGKQLESELLEKNHDVLFVQLNVASKESVQSMVDTVLSRYGKIDILINNAGITKDAMLVKMTRRGGFSTR